MPSRARRVPLTVPDNLDVSLGRVAKLQGIPKSKLIINILLEMESTLSDFADALEKVKSKKDPTSVLMGMTSRLLGDLSEELSIYNKFRDSSLQPNVQVGYGRTGD